MARSKKKDGKKGEFRVASQKDSAQEKQIEPSGTVDTSRNDILEGHHLKQPENDNDGIGSSEASDGRMDSLNEQIKGLKLELAKKNQFEVNNCDSESFSKVKAERDEFEKQYNNLLSRISSMKNVFNKIKASQNEAESLHEQLSEYESQNLKLKQRIELITKEKAELEHTVVTLNREFSSIEEERENVCKESQNHKKTIADLERQLEASNDSYTCELDFQKTQNNQLDTQLQELLLILDNNKHDISALRQERADLKSNVQDLEKENGNLKDSLKEIESELEKREQGFNDQLTARKAEISSLMSELEKNKASLMAQEKGIDDMKGEMEIMQSDLEKKERLEKECKDRVLQIGKLRHEAIILNEHLTKALAMLKQSSDSESVDKELMSNLLISFVAIPRADPRKFEVLELLASFLNWDDDKKRQAGLILNPQTSGGMPKSGSRTENFVSMWTDYLEKESE